MGVGGVLELEYVTGGCRFWKVTGRDGMVWPKHRGSTGEGEKNGVSFKVMEQMMNLVMLRGPHGWSSEGGRASECEETWGGRAGGI